MFSLILHILYQRYVWLLFSKLLILSTIMFEVYYFIIIKYNLKQYIKFIYKNNFLYDEIKLFIFLLGLFFCLFI